MSTALGILTAIILAASCFIGLKNKTAYKAKIDERIRLENNRDHVLRPKLEQTTAEKNQTLADKEKKQANKHTIAYCITLFLSEKDWG